MKKQLYYIGLYMVQGMRLLWRNRFYSLVTGVVVSLLLFVVYVFAAMSAHTAEAARKVDDRLVVTALIAQNKDYESEVSPSELSAQVKEVDNVKAVKIVTEQETQRRFLDNVRNLRSAPAPYIFNEALEISVHDVDSMKQVRDQVAALDGVERADYLADLVKKLTAVSSYLEEVALGGAVLLAIVALLVVMAVVRTSIHSEQHSVATMAAVGGSTWTIAAPLIIHMLAIILVATTLACVAGWWVDPQLGGQLGRSISNLPEWLQTGRSFSLFQLWPPMALASAAAVSIIVAYGTFRYTRNV